MSEAKYEPRSPLNAKLLDVDAPVNNLEISFDNRLESLEGEEVSRFSLSPENSRSYYHDKFKLQKFFELALMTTVKHGQYQKGKIYLKVNDKNSSIDWLYMDEKNKEHIGTLTIPAPNPFTLQSLMHLKPEILRELGKIGEASETTYHEGIECSTHTLKTEARNTLALQSQQQNKEVKVESQAVNHDEIGLIEMNGVPVFIPPGEHLFFEPGVKFLGKVKTIENIIRNGSECIVNVKPGEYYCVQKPYMMDDFRLLTPGKHRFNLGSGTVQKVTKKGKLLLVKETTDEKQNQAAEAKVAQMHEIKSEPKAEKGTLTRLEQIKEESKKMLAERKGFRVLYVTINEGKFGLFYNEIGKAIVVDGPKTFYVPAAWMYYDQYSGKAATLECKLRGIPTKDGITSNSTSMVTYQIKDPRRAMVDYGPNGTQGAIEHIAAKKAREMTQNTPIGRKTNAVKPALNLQMPGQPGQAPPPAYPVEDAAPPAYSLDVHGLAQANRELNGNGEPAVDALEILGITIETIEASDAEVARALNEREAAEIRMNTTEEQAMSQIRINEAQQASEYKMELASIQHERSMIGEKTELVKEQGTFNITLAKQAKAIAVELGITPMEAFKMLKEEANKSVAIHLPSPSAAGHRSAMFTPAVAEQKTATPVQVTLPGS